MGLTAKDAADDVMQRARDILTHAKRMPGDPSSATTIEVDLWRMSLALGVAALDTYLHWAVTRAPLDVLPNALRSINVPFGDLVDSGRATVNQRQQNIADRPQVRARNTLSRVLLDKTFQSSTAVAEAMAMLGVRKCWTKIADAMDSSGRAQELAERLDQIVRTRNRIVHEGDLQRQSRPRKIKRHWHASVDIENDLDWLSDLIAALDHVLA